MLKGTFQRRLTIIGFALALILAAGGFLRIGNAEASPWWVSHSELAEETK